MTIVHAWVALSAIGSIVSLYLTRESLLDLMALPKDANGRRTAAWSRLIREFLRVTVHAGYLAVGIPLLDRQEIQNNFFISVLVWGNVVLVLNSLIDARARRLLFATREAEPTLPH